jgi:predicted unusual protein kinase regulating ubiquinone biosynthesis (AarF/ABC1/UbiB family)
MQYHPSLAKKLFPIPEKPVFPKWLGFFNLIYDSTLILAYSIKSPRFFKGTKLALTLLFALQQEVNFEKHGGNPQKLAQDRQKHAKWLYLQLTDLAAAFIKVGQFISTREDLVPKEYVQELKGLQDGAIPLPIETIKTVIKKSLGQAPEDLFEYIEETAIASASIGQVHRATTKKGQQVVLKVQRPNLDQLFLQDLSIARAFAVFFERHFKWGKNRYWPEICDEFGKVLFQEIDFYQEALNAERLKLNLEDKHPELIVPSIHWDYVSKEVLAMQYVPGKRITDFAALKEAGRTPHWVSDKLLSIFADQFFVGCFFHADPHPGNISITKDGQIVLYDYGMTYRIDHKIRDNFKDAIIALVSQNTDALLESLKKMDLLRPGADLVLLKSLIQKTTYKYYGGGRLKDLQVEEIKDDINKVIANSPIRMAPSLAYLFRTIGILEGLCRTFDPDFNFIKALKPLTQEWFMASKQIGPLEKIANKLGQKLDFAQYGQLLEVAKLPLKANNLLSKMESGEMSIPIDLGPMQQRMERIENTTQGMAYMLIGVCFTGAGVFLWQNLDLSVLVWGGPLGIASLFFVFGIKRIFT